MCRNWQMWIHVFIRFYFKITLYFITKVGYCLLHSDAKISWNYLYWFVWIYEWFMCLKLRWLFLKVDIKQSVIKWAFNIDCQSFCFSIMSTQKGFLSIWRRVTFLSKGTLFWQIGNSKMWLSNILTIYVLHINLTFTTI